MPRYFFHVLDGFSIRDEVGTEFANWRAAQVAAIDLAGAILRDHAAIIQLGEEWSMEVTTDRGLVLFRLDFHIAGSAAILGDTATVGERTN